MKKLLIILAAIGRPYFPLMKVHLENGKTLEINAANADGSADYLADHDIKEITVGGRKWKGNFFRYSDLAKGNVIEFTMER